MRHDDPSDSSSRIVWTVSGILGLLLLVWASGWSPLDFSGGETGHLSPDPGEAGASRADGSSSRLAFDPRAIPPQSEPEIIDVPASSDVDTWGHEEFAAHRLEASLNPSSAGGWNALPSGLEVPPVEVERTDPPRALERSAAKPIVPRQVWRTAEPGSEFELVQAERFDDLPPANEPPPAPEKARPRAPVPSAPVVDLSGIDAMLQAGRFAEAHVALSRIWWESPTARAAIRSRIERTAATVYFEPDVHFVEPYVVQRGDRLSTIGERFDVPWQYLVRLNRADPRNIRPGDSLKVVPGPFHARIDLSERTLTVHNNGLFVRQYTIGLGPNRSPAGQYAVLERRPRPDFRTPDGRTISGGDRSNPLGDRWIGLGRGYALHGTHDPSLVGRETAFGCLFLRNEDVVEVYDLLGIGSNVNVED